eukprot:COSAG06_NODE_4216_length_4466_cov_2.884360_7_plen_50_part_00
MDLSKRDCTAVPQADTGSVLRRPEPPGAEKRFSAFFEFSLCLSEPVLAK